MTDDTAPAPAPVELLICVKCKRAGEAPLDPEAPRPGAALHAATAALFAENPPEGVTVTAVECLQNCEAGCTVALRGGPARWTYVYGALDPATGAPLLLDGAARYRETGDGLIPWRQRPEHFKRNCVARIPPLEPQDV